ncbi:hypothetical protein LTR36_006224 [Oleoguttula mirabilis]|uniref:GAT domain-containing protein n=1 Tax=Oleoguttula mirabilis TaxID=1507867 RepID=A0AAV9JCH0_9PEZI|nr:hypothetical protein LTR36_006224 [Oleoguttula mirabilis]
MKRFTSLLNRTKSHDSTNTNGYDLRNAPVDSPEANAGRAIRLFCESGSTADGEEVLHLPVIVEAAESAPAAAAAAAHQIRKYLSREWSSKGQVQYRSIMLIRILSDNPGATFTRNFDKGFVSTVKDLLRNGRDQGTQTILRETLDALEVNKGYDEGLQCLLQMWRKEKGQQASLSHSGSRRTAPQGHQGPNGQRMSYQQQPGTQYVQPGTQYPQPGAQYQNVYGGGMNGQPQQPAGRPGGGHQLPAPHELASRIEEARNTAKILMQLIQSTPAEELMQNDLVKEFSERCQSAQKSMQGYINCDSPPPDDDTMQTLIEANEQLSVAGSRYQRAVLAARRAMGASSSPNAEAMSNGSPAFANGTGAFTGVPPLGQQQSLTPPQSYANVNYSQQPQQPPQTSGYDDYRAPSSPPPHMMNSLQQREAQHSQTAYLPPQRYQQQPTLPMPDGLNNPFADPFEHDANPAPLAIEPTNYGSAAHGMPTRQPTSHRQQPSQTFSIDASEPTYASSASGGSAPYDRRNTVDLDNAYAHPSSASPAVSAPSPTLTRGDRGSDASVVSGFAPQLSPNAQTERSRPGPGPWHNSGVTPSYLGRQTSALNGLTMHGAQSVDDDIAEIDTHGDVGRNDTSSATTTHSSGATSSRYAETPVEVRVAQQARRVDVAGTGGFRKSVIERN